MHNFNLAKSIYKITSEACSLDERLKLPVDKPLYSFVHVDQTLARWRKAYSGGDQQAFLKRLSLQGLTEKQVRYILASEPDFSEGLPAWTETLEAVLNLCPEVLADVQQGKCVEHNPMAEKGPVAFPELWLPFLRLATRLLSERVGAALGLISEKALRSLQSQLLREVSGYGSLAAYNQFSAFRHARLFALQVVRENSCRLYHSFVINLLKAHLTPLFEEYSVLARQLCRLVDTWVEATSDLLLRLEKDSHLIACQFNRGQELGHVVELKPSLSDRHHGGRSVALLVFSSGLKLIYKPRDVKQEYVYNRLLKWTERKAVVELLPSLKVLQCDGYGWVEFVAQSPCCSEEEVERYYRQAGMLVCLIYILGGNDFHMENLVASRKGPVLVDVESLMQAYSANQKGDDSQGFLDLGNAPEDNSVLSTCFLNTLGASGPDGRMSDISGLRGMADSDHYNKKRVWLFLNTDAMKIQYEMIRVEPTQNLLLFNGQFQYPEDNAEAIVDGFTRFYQFIISYREAISAHEGPLYLFKETPTRVIYRASNDYAILLHGLATPGYQRNGLDRSITLGYLGKAFQNWDKDQPSRHIIHQERQALENLDIPHFSISCSFESIVDRLNNLTIEDLERQNEFIRAALHVFKDADDYVSLSDSNGEMQPGEIYRLNLVNQAELIAEHIQARAIFRADGAVTWPAPAFERLDRAYKDYETEISYHLYGGASGIALFLAALASVTDNKEYTTLAEATCNSVTRSVENDYSIPHLDNECIGACNGLGSVVYSLVTISRILKNDAYLDLAKRVAVLITPARIFADQRLDIEGGSAGCLIALLALYSLVEDPCILEQASYCAQHLLDCSHVHDGKRGWKNSEGIMLAGFAHGASGIALALFRLYQITGKRLYLTAGQEAFQYERELFSKERGNWPVLRKKRNNKIDASLFMTAWCHGASGIGLARIGALEILDDAKVHTDIEHAIRSTIDYDLASLDHLCCGNLGRAEVLLTSGLVMNRPELIRLAQDRMFQVIRRAQQEGYFCMRLKTWENRCFQPGFFKGLSGIGYTMLRMAYPRVLPSILFFEP